MGTMRKEFETWVRDGDYSAVGTVTEPTQFNRNALLLPEDYTNPEAQTPPDYQLAATQRLWAAWRAAWCMKTQTTIDESEIAKLRELAGQRLMALQAAEGKLAALEFEVIALKVSKIELATAPPSARQFETYRSAKRRTARLEDGASLREMFDVEKTYGDKYVAKLRANTKVKAGQSC